MGALVPTGTWGEKEQENQLYLPALEFLQQH